MSKAHTGSTQSKDGGRTSEESDRRLFGFDGVRLHKRARLFERGDVVPYSFDRSHRITEVLAEVYRVEAAGGELSFSVSIVGRIWSRRRMGRIRFLDLRDETDKIQLHLSRDQLSKEVWDLLSLLDLGDIVGVSGPVFRTRTGEISVDVQELDILAKSVIPIPIGKETEDSTFSRATDPELRYRERYLNWILNPEERSRMEMRSRIISEIRRWMEAEGFLEVNTPTIELVYGGAEARPFRTSIWALGSQEAYLRISPELYLKRYIVGGFPKVFTICQNFRNEGIDHSHNPEFTMMEWYEAFTDYEAQMARFENLVAHVCREIRGSTKVEYQGALLDFSPPWRRLSVIEALRKIGGVDAESTSATDLRRQLSARGRDLPETTPWGILVAELFEELCEEELVQPTFIIDHPAEISPLTRVKRGDPRLVERFEPYAWGMEIGNAYSELTDAVEQAERLRAQRSRDDPADDYENHPIDADFVRALGCGMPPTGGVGLGIDRLIMLLTDAPSIRDILPFPMVRPKP